MSFQIETLESRQLLSVTPLSVRAVPAGSALAVTQVTTSVYGTVAGSVTDVNGKPIANASVSLIASGVSLPAVLTDAAGVYTVTNVPAGTYLAKATATGYLQSYSASFTVVAGSNVGPTFKLTIAGIVSGLITDGNNAALPGALVTIAAYPITSTSYHAGVLSDSTGHYTFPSIALGTYLLEVSKTGYIARNSATFNVVAGQNIAPTVALTQIVYGSVTGKVTDSNGVPIPNASVHLISSPGGASLPAVQTNANGVYGMTSVPTGTYIAEAIVTGYLSAYSATFTVVKGTNAGPTFKLTAAGIVSGLVTDTNNIAVAGALVTIEAYPITSTSFHAGVLSDSNGKYTFPSIAVGTYIVSVSKTGYFTTNSATFNVVVGPDTAPTVKLPIAPIITGTGPGTTTSPGPLLTTLTPTFTWKPATGVTGYEIYLYDLTASKQYFYVINSPTQTSFKLTSALTAGHLYSWNIRAVFNGQAGPINTYYYFQT